jgi:hypothetical protein
MAEADARALGSGCGASGTGACSMCPGAPAHAFTAFVALLPGPNIVSMGFSSCFTSCEGVSA